MKKILILAANPKDTSKLSLDEEVREIQSAHIQGKNREEIEILSQWALQVDDLRWALLYHEPNIVHFCGHGAGDDGLVLENEHGQKQLVSSESLGGLFELCQKHVECVVLNACYSEVQAEAIHRHINCVVGMNKAIGDEAAIKFATGFYDALANGRNYQDSFDFGCNAIDLKNIPESQTPQIKIKDSSKSLLTPDPRDTKSKNGENEKDSSKSAISQKQSKKIPNTRRYRLMDTLDEKDHISVYKVHDRYLDRNIAMKVLYSNNEELKENFKKSAQKAVKISSQPNFITIYDASFKKNKNYYYTMEFIEGQTIREYIDDPKKPKLTFEQKCKIILKVGDALVRARDSKLPHSNIKPSNILLFKVYIGDNVEYEPFISPINLSEELSYESIKNNLNELQQQNKKEYQEELAYLIPEEYKLTRKYEGSESPKSPGQYRLGRLAYELFTEEIPTTSQDHKDLVDDKAFQLQLLREKCPDYPEIIEEIIHKMASPNPEERYKKIEDALELIRRHIGFYLNTVKESYKRCTAVENFDNEFFEIFYQKFVRKCPHARKKFSTFEETEKEKEKEYWNRQHQLLKQSIIFLFAYFEENKDFSSDYYKQQEPNILSRIAEIHDRRHKDISTKMYEEFINALIETVIEFDPWCKVDDSNLNQEQDELTLLKEQLLREAWEKVLKTGTDYMKSKY